MKTNNFEKNSKKWLLKFSEKIKIEDTDEIKLSLNYTKETNQDDYVIEEIAADNYWVHLHTNELVFDLKNLQGKTKFSILLEPKSTKGEIKTEEHGLFFNDYPIKSPMINFYSTKLDGFLENFKTAGAVVISTSTTLMTFLDPHFALKIIKMI